MQEQTERRFSSLVQNSSDVVAVIGADTTIRYLSPSVQRVLGYRSSDLLGTALTSIVHPDEQAHVVEFLTGASASAGPELVEFKVRHRNGDWLEAETLRTNLLTDESVRGIVLNTRDISERKAIERQLEHHAFSDPVTGLANRALFRDRVDHALAQGHRAGRTVAVMFMDLDDFKIINDTFGHATGDALLSAVGGRLRECLRDADTAARLGGDEFAILLEDADDRVDAVEVARRILDALDAPFAIDDRQLTIRASVGIAYANGATLGARATEELLRNADVAMYTAKGQGKSQHAVYQPTMHKNMIQRLELRGDLQQALDRSEFELYYQPIINLATREISGIEALVRWQHPRRGTISPADFIPLAEETGVIIPLGSWVLETACQTARGLQTKYPQATSLTVSVNLSSRQLQWPGLVSDVRHALRASGLQPSSLTLEVTESVMMQNIELSVLRLKELKELGVRIAIDDFGTGYSSLNYIRRFPLDILKVDKSFIDHISEDGEELALTSAIIDLANLLHLEPVAEGIERPDQLQRLVDIDCGFGQGYYFATPAPGDVIEQRLAEQHDAAA